MSRRRAYVDAPIEDLTTALLFTIGWDREGAVPVYVNGSRAFTVALDQGVTLAAERLARRAKAVDERWGAQVEIGLPSESSALCCWAWISSRESLERAQRFYPPPPVVLRVGGGASRLLMWGLVERVPWVRLVPRNERISYVLRGARTRCEPEKLRIPLPGTFIRQGRARPAPVVATRLAESEFTLAEVTGQLREPPSKDAWRERV